MAATAAAAAAHDCVSLAPTPQLTTARATPAAELASATARTATKPTAADKAAPKAAIALLTAWAILAVAGSLPATA